MISIYGNLFIKGAFKKGTITFDQSIKTLQINKRKKDALDYDECYIVPGFIDIHTNGACGVEFLSENVDHEKFINYQFSQGITTSFPTFIGQPIEVLENILNNWEWELYSGVHLEGPFISHAKRGVHPIIQNYDETYLERISKVIPENKSVMLTFAPEIEGADRLTQFALEKNWTLSSGHTECTYDQAFLAIKEGVKTCTHLFNGMSGLHHREGGAALAYLNSDDTIVQIIADGIHVDIPMLQLVKTMKTAAEIAVVTDSLPPCGLGDGTYEWAHQQIIKENNRATINNKLAGGVAQTAEIFKTLLEAGFSLEELITMRSSTPAICTGLSKIGKIKEKYRSDILILSPDLKVKEVYKEGQKRYTS